MKTDAYLITCLTNLHVGSGESNYGVVDNLVQRDPITDVPMIHSSSLKGALREHFKNVWNDECHPKLNYIFGRDDTRCKDKQQNSTKAESKIGHYKFFEANLIVLPVRSNREPFFRATSFNLIVLPVRSNREPFFRATSFDFLKDVNEKAKALGIQNFNINPFTNDISNKSNPIVANEFNNVVLESWKGNGFNNLPTNNFIGKNPALFHTDTFKELANHLPVIARNQLENGESKNLWYEEVVPRESRFVFFVSKPEENGTVKYETDFDDELKNKVVQIGGNASIGYGYCKLEKLVSKQ